MRAALYQRVSEDRAAGRSVTEQETENRRVCEANGWDIVATFTDNDRGASRHSRARRPEWDRLITYLERGQADVLVTWEASRSTRDLAVYVELRRVCRTNSVLLSYMGRTYDLERGDDSFFSGLEALLAEKEAEQTRDRVLRSKRASAEQGRPDGKIPFGYRREYDPHSGRLLNQVVDETQAALIREAAERVLAGESCYAVACDWNDRGIKAPRAGKWRPEQIKRAIIRPTVVGKRVYQGTVVGDASWPPILDELTWHRAVALLTDPSRRTTTEDQVKHLLTGIAVCGVDGCGVTVRRIKNRGCPSYACPAAFHVSRKIEHVDAYVTAVVLARLARPDAADMFAPDDGADRDLLADIAERRNRLTGFYDEAAIGNISPAALARIEAQLLPEIEALERQIQRTRATPLVSSLAVPHPDAIWEALTVLQRREVIATLCQVLIHPVKQGPRAFCPAGVEIRWI